MEQQDNDFLTEPPQMQSLAVLEYANIYSTTEHASVGHELLYVLDGKITLHLEEQLAFQAVPGDFLIVKAGTRHRDEFAVLKGLRIMLLHFSWPCDDYFRVVNNHSLLHLSYDVRNEVRRRLDFIHATRDNTPGEMRHLSIQLHGILLLFYFDLQKSCKAADSQHLLPRQEAMRRVRHFMDQNYAEPLSLKQTAAHVGLSPAYLSRIFHKEYGISFSQYLTARRLEAARHLLQNGQLQIGEIASRCGFGSGSYFIRVFREHYGVTPKNYHLL